jgi:hypothetical protein
MNECITGIVVSNDRSSRTSSPARRDAIKRFSDLLLLFCTFPIDFFVFFKNLSEVVERSLSHNRQRVPAGVENFCLVRASQFQCFLRCACGVALLLSPSISFFNNFVFFSPPRAKIMFETKQKKLSLHASNQIG